MKIDFKIKKNSKLNLPIYKEDAKSLSRELISESIYFYFFKY